MTDQTWEYLGFNYASWWNGKFADVQSTDALTQLSDTGVTTATIVATHYLGDRQSSDIFATAQTESLENVEKAIKDAQNAGLSTWLKPHVDLTSGEWRGLLNPTDRDTFFDNYKTLLLDYAQLAQANNVEVLVLGTELDGLMNASDKDAWLDIIEAVRQVYDGKLTYAANWDTADKVPFASALDFVGVDAYYPLTSDTNASVEDLVQAWITSPEDSRVSEVTGGLSIVDWLRQVSEGYGKSIVFTEVGFRSVDGTANNPFEYQGQGTVDLEEQARLFEALFQVFSGQVPEAGNMDWFLGAQFWNWYATADQNQDPTDTDYSILGKPAEAIFKDYIAQLTDPSLASDDEVAPETDPLPAEETTVPPETNPPETDLSPAPNPLAFEFKVTADWGNGFSGDLYVTNTGETAIEDWILEFNAPYSLGETWNAGIIDLGNGRYQVQSTDAASWNQVISPGETISFGFVGNAETPVSPTDFLMTGQGLPDPTSSNTDSEPEPEPETPPTSETESDSTPPPESDPVPDSEATSEPESDSEMTSEPEEASEPDPTTEPEPEPETNSDTLDFDFRVTADWDSGFSGDMFITNRGGTPIENWKLEFETTYSIGATWNATITALDDNRYQAHVADTTAWNAEISPGETISFGFVGNGETPAEPTQFLMTGDGLPLEGVSFGTEDGGMTTAPLP